MGGSRLKCVLWHASMEDGPVLEGVLGPLVVVWGICLALAVLVATPTLRDLDLVCSVRLAAVSSAFLAATTLPLGVPLATAPSTPSIQVGLVLACNGRLALRKDVTGRLVADAGAEEVGCCVLLCCILRLLRRKCLHVPLHLAKRAIWNSGCGLRRPPLLLASVSGEVLSFCGVVGPQAL